MVPANIFIRPMRESERQQFATWLHQHRDVNQYDPSILNGLSRVFVAVAQDGTIIAYLPISVAIFMGCLSPNPTVDKSTLARGIAAFNQFVVSKALTESCSDVIVQSTTPEFAAVMKDFGYDEPKLPVLKFRVTKLDRKPDEIQHTPAQPSPSSDNKPVHE